MLVNSRTGAVVAQDVEIADTRATRRRGLLGRDGLAAGSALVITPCFAVHTACMRFAIDVVFVDREGFVVRVVTDLGPWRIAAAWGAHSVIELPAGTVQSGVRAGDRVYLVGAAETEGDASSSSSRDVISFRNTASKPACSGS
jgi:uncharacterized membrane protein (UPF0127 family)